jgi:hypothetical protein
MEKSCKVVGSSKAGGSSKALRSSKQSEIFPVGCYVAAVYDGELFLFCFLKYFFGGFFSFCSYNIQHCFICRPSDSTVPTDAGIEPRTIATGALAVRRSNH